MPWHRITLIAAGTLVAVVAAWFFIQSQLPEDSGAGLEPSGARAGTEPTAPRPSEIDDLVRAIRDGSTEYGQFAAALAVGAIGDPEALAALARTFAVQDAVPAGAFTCDLAVGRLAALDLPAAVSIVRATSDPLRSRLASAVTGGLELADPSVAVAVFGAGSLDDENAVALLRRVISGGTAAVLAELRETDPASVHGVEHGRLATLLATDAEAAMEQINAIGDRGARMAMAAAILVDYAAIDPASAFDWCSRLGDPENEYQLRRARSEVLGLWLASDPAGARKIIFDPDFPVANDTIIPVAAFLAEHDPALALEWTGSHIGSSDLRDSAESRLFQVLGEKDPAGAIALLDDSVQISSAKVEGLTRTFVNHWAQSQPEKALAWTLAQSGARREGAMDGYQNLAYREDPDAVFALAESASLHADERAELVENSASLAARDLPRYLRLAGTLPEERSFAVLARAAGELARKGRLEDSRAIVEAVGVGTAAVRGVTQRTVTEMARIDPDAARQWVESFTDPEVRVQGVRNVVDAWVRLDPPAAARYVDGLAPGSEERELAAFTMAQRTLAQDPAGALAWVDSLTDPEQRERFISQNIIPLLVHAPDRLAALAAGDPDLRARIEREKTWQSVLRGDPFPAE